MNNLAGSLTPLEGRLLTGTKLLLLMSDKTPSLLLTMGVVPPRGPLTIPPLIIGPPGLAVGPPALVIGPPVLVVGPPPVPPLVARRRIGVGPLAVLAVPLVIIGPGLIIPGVVGPVPLILPPLLVLESP